MNLNRKSSFDKIFQFKTLRHFVRDWKKNHAIELVHSIVFFSCNIYPNASKLARNSSENDEMERLLGSN